MLAHEQTVIKTFEQYASGDYAGSYDTFREGYKLMFGVGQALGDAIVKQSPDKFAETQMPTDMPKTGLGGASEATTNPLTLVVFRSMSEKHLKIRIQKELAIM